MPATAEQLTEVEVWLDQHAAVSEQVKEQVRDTARDAWAAFGAWYSTVAVTALAKEMSDLSTASQDVIAGSAQQFIGNVAAVLRGTKVTIPRTSLPPVRNGAPLPLVHTRPAERYRKAVATGWTPEQAEAYATYLAGDLQVQDMSLAERASQQFLMEELGITQFRRIVRPELAKSKSSCGLCIAASSRIYNSATMMPMHDNCNCLTMPIIGDVDPGKDLNNKDLGQLYQDAGSTKAADLKRTRYMLNEHGEYGPVLTREGDSFRGPGSVALENDPKRAARLLGKAAPVLEAMEATETPDGPLSYQRDFVARLQSITDAA